MKVAMVFYSFSGNTKRVCLFLKEKLAAKNIDVDLIDLRPKMETRSFFKQSKQALFKEKVELLRAQDDLSRYDYIAFASPVWAFTFAPALRSFLDKVKGVEGKRAICFLTYGSGTGSGKALRELETILEEKKAEIIFSVNLSGFKVKKNDYLEKRFKTLFNIIGLQKTEYREQKTEE